MHPSMKLITVFITDCGISHAFKEALYIHSLPKVKFVKNFEYFPME